MVLVDFGLLVDGLLVKFVRAIRCGEGGEGVKGSYGGAASLEAMGVKLQVLTAASQEDHGNWRAFLAGKKEQAGLWGKGLFGRGIYRGDSGWRVSG